MPTKKLQKRPREINLKCQQHHSEHTSEGHLRQRRIMPEMFFFSKQPSSLWDTCAIFCSFFVIARIFFILLNLSLTFFFITQVYTLFRSLAAVFRSYTLFYGEITEGTISGFFRNKWFMMCESTYNQG